VNTLLIAITWVNWIFAFCPYLTLMGVWLLARRAEMMAKQFPLVVRDNIAHIRFHDGVYQHLDQFSSLSFSISAVSLVAWLPLTLAVFLLYWRYHRTLALAPSFASRWLWIAGSLLLGSLISSMM
jgi:hypothetical protein